MNLRRLLPAIATALSLALIACSPQDSTGSSAPASAISVDQAYDTLASKAKGFTVGAMLSVNPVYVLFDPQCPHCGHLWNASLPLLNKVKFVWIPVAIINAKSATQGAALLQASNPVEAMTAHEQSLLSQQGGMSASSSVPADLEASIKSNTQLLNNLGADSVPFIVARHGPSGQTVTQAGSMDTRALADFLGIAQP